MSRNKSKDCDKMCGKSSAILSWVATNVVNLAFNYIISFLIWKPSRKFAEMCHKGLFNYEFLNEAININIKIPYLMTCND
jgi:hypothetical protein